MAYVYLNVRSDARHSRFGKTSDLREFLRKDPRLLQHGLVEFRNSNTTPWLTLTMIRASADGNFSVNGDDPGSFNLVELIGSADVDGHSYRDIAARIASFLGWELVDVTH